MPHELYVTKADGTRELFQVNKLKNSLKRAGASENQVRDILSQIDTHVFDGVTTEALYKLAFELLRGTEDTSAARYSLRRAMISLGPTGFPFEDYLAKLFAAQGYTTKTRVILKGKCVTHEVDVVAYKDDHSFVAEAKFHAQPGIKSDLQVVLYSHARFMDIAGTRLHTRDTQGMTTGKVITNTKFTTTAIQYAKCAGMDLLSWDYPRKNNLQDMIEATRLYPVTVLQTLSVREKRALLETGNVLCSDIIDNNNLLRSIGVPQKKMGAIMQEGARLHNFLDPCYTVHALINGLVFCMEDKEKNQKTVVAFIAGLLIGGLLVWVFSIAPEKKEKDVVIDDTNATSSENTDGTTNDGTKPADTSISATPRDTNAAAPRETVVAQGDGSVTVDDQSAGLVVNLGEVKMPVPSGWIAVHELNADGSLANVLGAARYTEADGLKPTSVDLLRATKAGQSYRVVIYSENGDKKFSISGGDKLVTKEGGSPIEDAFTAK